MKRAVQRLAISGLCLLVAILPLPLWVGPAWAGPSGEVVIEGDAKFDRPDDHTTIIHTTTDKTIVEYDGFDILPDELVDIKQPSETSKIINHVPHGDPTRIGGRLQSNGYVYIVNPSGVFFGDQAVVDVGGMVAAAGRISYDEFMAGQERFTDLGGEVVVAEGAMLRADDTVALLGERVASYGTIVSEGGMVAFVAGGEAVLGSLDGRMIVRVDSGGNGEDATAGDVVPASGTSPDDGFALTQGGHVDAGTGRVLLTAGDTWSLAMNHTGITRGGGVELHAEGEGLVQVAGTLDASGREEGETGGRIEVTGDKVALVGATLDARGDAGGGEIRVGGDVQGRGELRTARRTYVSDDSQLLADAVTNGDGGSIAVWSEEKTGFFGHASARGGEEGGDGGFVEISGRQSLVARGHHVDVSAPQGASGTLLYDPARILIRGGTLDGHDEDVGDLADLLDNGELGRILEGDVADAESFVVYESEIEGTDANIVLQATESIVVEDDQAFGNDDVVVTPGNSLVIQTTGDPSDASLSPDGFAIDLGDDLTWQVSEGGVIDIRTQAGDTSNPEESARANIRVGTLVFSGREYVFDAETGLSTPQLVTADAELAPFGLDPNAGVAVNVQTEVGDIVVGEIRANGTDAADGGAISASSAGNVTVQTSSGDIEVGRVESRGGGALLAGDPDGPAPSEGGLGGSVQIASFDGSVTILDGGIDVSGGQGLAGFVATDELEDDDIVAGVGGAGGSIELTALSQDEETARTITVQGDLLANGGNGEGQIGIPDGSGGTLQLSGVGGTSGRIALTTTGGIVVQGEALDPLRIQANGGDGLSNNVFLERTAGGASQRGSGAGAAIFMLIQEGEDTPESTGITISNADLQANGGNAMTGGAGGQGGAGGNVLIGAGDGAVMASDGVTLEASGGNGAATLFPEGETAQSGAGGNAFVVTISGAAGVAVGDITATGGTGATGDGGQGANVAISSQLGDVEVADIDVSGGNATTTLEEQVVSGGAAGSVSLDTTTTTVDDEDQTVPGGDVVIGGRVRGFGGTGQDAEGEQTRAAGATLDVESDSAILSAGGSLEGHQVNLIAPYVGWDPTEGIGITPIDIAGTAADDDSALLTTSQSQDTANVPATLFVNLLTQHGPDASEAGSGLETVQVLLDDETANAELRSGGTLILQADGGAMAGDDVDLLLMGIGDDADPRLEFELDALVEGGVTEGTPSVVVAVDKVRLGTAGGSITNGDGAIVGAAGATGTQAHVESTGNVVLEALSIGEDDEALRVDGAPNASLALRATGDVDVSVVDGGDFGALDVTQRQATAETRILGLDAFGDPMGNPLLQVLDVTDPDEEDAPRASLTADTAGSGTDLAYRHVGFAPGGGTAPALIVQDAVLGGDGVLEVTGTLELARTDGPSVALLGAGSDLLLDAGGDVLGMEPGVTHVSLSDGDADDPASLAIDAGGAIRGAGDDDALVTENVERLAARFGDDMILENQDADAGDRLEIAQVEILDPTDTTGETVAITYTGILGGSQPGNDLVLDNGDRAIVLGDVPVADPAAPPFHVSVAGSASFLSPLLVENPRYAQPPTPDGDVLGESELVAVNIGRIGASNVLFTGPIDTGPDTTAVDDITDPDDPDATPAPDVDLQATLLVDTIGTATYQGDVGAGSPLARFETGNAVMDGDDRQVRAGQVVFRGTLDGPANLVVQGVDTALSDEDEETSVVFGGNVGVNNPLQGLVVQARRIDFARAGGGSAELVNAGSGGIHLDTGQSESEIPAVATITDAQGNLRFQTSGDFAVGELDKLAAVGNLEIAAQTITVGDLSAAGRISVSSPFITVMTRAGGPVKLPDGSTIMDMGVDWVANDIVATSALQPSEPGFIGLYIGDGGLSIPDDLGNYTVRYATPGLDAITVAMLTGEDGRLLDLTGNGPGVVGDPTRDMPRYVEPPRPQEAPQFGSDAPAPGPRVSARQVLAFLRCSGLAPDAPGCGAEDEDALAAVGRFDESALATIRAREITARYRDLLSEPEASQRLRQAFAAAGRAYRQSVEWRDGTLDGAAFYRFLATARGDTAEALASVRELAWLFAEIDLLGLSDDDTRRLQQSLAREFAAAAGLQGFDATAVTAAVDASPVGLP